MALFNRRGESDNPARQRELDFPQTADEQAIARYRYLLRTASPEAIEQAHAEAFAQLTLEQRRQVLEQIAKNASASERTSVEKSEVSPEALARIATRAEIRRPGAMESMFGRAGGIGLGGLMAGSLLSSIAGTVVGSMIAQKFFANEGHEGNADSDSAQESSKDSESAESDYAADDGGDFDAGGFDV
ncbi:MAG TPA: hypothetical protein VM532_06130 [Burkholderiales bacterium]|nr:hypothetical protein [Burkholderiales bacterium]